MGQILMSGSGGGVGSDDCTALKKHVLHGYSAVTADSDDETVEGTMINQGSAKHGTGVGLNTYGVYYYIPEGYYTEGSLTPWVFMTRAEVATALGIVAWKFRSDQNICGVQGSIPLQNPDVSGASDQAWATNWSNWGDGNIFMGVRNGHYLNGVNWVRANIPGFVAANIKKGVNVGGIIGTFEGYVPTATDLYLRGNNIRAWYTSSGSGMDSGQISMLSNTMSLYTTNYDISLTGFNRLNIEGYANNGSGILKAMRLYQYITANTFNLLGYLDLQNYGSGPYIYSFDISMHQVTGRLRISCDYMNGAVYRIWLS